jgi:hypothetical protein
MSDKFLLASYYTENTAYEDICKEFFIKSCNKLNLEYIVKKIPNYHSWHKNTAHKAQVILTLLEEMKKNKDNRLLVFTDSDSEILEYPIFFDNIDDQYDMSLHYLDWESWYRNGIKKKELLSGTIVFRNNEKVRALCKEWFDKAILTTRWEQTILEEIIKSYNINLLELPIEYIYLATLPNGNKPHVVVDRPVILHHQCSRKLKRSIR